MYIPNGIARLNGAGLQAGRGWCKMTGVTVARKRRKGRVTSSRIVETAARILLEEGPQQITTGRLAEASGIVQSGFYTHFKNTEEVLIAAAEQIGTHLRKVAGEGQAQIVALQGGTVAQLAQHYANLFRLLLEDRHFTELFLQYRRAPTPLGQMLRGFERGITLDTAGFLAQMARQSPVPRPEDLELSESIIGMFWACMDALLSSEKGEVALEDIAMRLAVVSKISAELTYGNVDRKRLMEQANLGLKL